MITNIMVPYSEYRGRIVPYASNRPQHSLGKKVRYLHEREPPCTACPRETTGVDKRRLVLSFPNNPLDLELGM